MSADKAATIKMGLRLVEPVSEPQGESTISAGQFATAVADLLTAARGLGLQVPSYRSPPRSPGLDRAITRLGGDCIVSVRVGGRPKSAVLADAVEGIVVVNGLTGAQASRVRRQLWLAVDDGEAVAGQGRAADGRAANTHGLRLVEGGGESGQYEWDGNEQTEAAANWMPPMAAAA